MERFKGKGRMGGLFLMVGNDGLRISSESLVTDQDEIKLPSGITVRGSRASLVREYIGPGTLAVALELVGDYFYRYVPVRYEGLDFETKVLRPFNNMVFEAQTIGHRVLDLSENQVIELGEGRTVQLDEEELILDFIA